MPRPEWTHSGARKFSSSVDGFRLRVSSVRLANDAGKLPFFLKTAGVLLRARGRRHAPASFEAIAGRNATGNLPLTKIKTSNEDPTSFSKTKRRLEVSCAIFCLSVCLHFPSSAALDRLQRPLPGVVRTYPRLGRTSIACRDVRGAIRAIASSRLMTNAWPLHPAPTPIAV